MKHIFDPEQALKKVRIFKPVTVFLFVLFLCSGNSLLYAQESGSVSIRALQKVEDASPVMMAGFTETKDAVRYAEEKAAGQNKDTTPAKPDIKAASPETSDEYGDVTPEPDIKAASPATSDEYGDVTPEQLGIAPKARQSSDEYGDVSTEDLTGADTGEETYDPIRPFNTAMYHFNDKVYFWAWKPVSTGYKYVVPEEVRSVLVNFYENLKAPIRIVNNLLQGDPAHAGTEFLSLLINSTIGVGGLRNCAEECFGIQRDYADFGQTLGKWGFGYGFYLVLPFLGPSDVRDGVGLLFDWPMRPTSYVGTNFFNVYNVGLYIHERVNYTSFHLGEYEALQSAAVDPYIAMRDIYLQYRNSLIRKP